MVMFNSYVKLPEGNLLSKRTKHSPNKVFFYCPGGKKTLGFFARHGSREAGTPGSGEASGGHRSAVFENFGWKTTSVMLS